MINSSWLVTIKTSDGVGSGIVVSSVGHILTCYHNICTNSGSERTITEVIPRVERTSGDPNSVLQEAPVQGGNIEKIVPNEDKGFARRHDLFVIRGPKVVFEKITPPIFSKRESLKKGEKVWVLAYDERASGVWCSLLDVLQFSDGEKGKPPQIILSKEHGFPGMSGGGVFTENGELVGIINNIDKERHDRIIASPIFYKKIDEEWVPSRTSTIATPIIITGHQEHKSESTTKDSNSNPKEYSTAEIKELQKLLSMGVSDSNQIMQIATFSDIDTTGLVLTGAPSQQWFELLRHARGSIEDDIQKLVENALDTSPKNKYLLEAKKLIEKHYSGE